MVSFRLTWDEYQALRDACATSGVRSLSELAREAMQQIIASRCNGVSLDNQVRELRDQMSMLSRELERIARRVDQQEEFSSAQAEVGDCV